MSNFPPKPDRAFYRDGLKKQNLDNDAAYREMAALVMLFLKNFWLEKGYSPSIDEIGYSCVLPRTTVYYWVRRMREKGDLLFEDNVSRSFRLPGQTVNFADENKVS